MAKPGTPFEKELAKVNRKMDRVRIERRGKKLSLRATLPPKPGETSPKQRYIPTQKPANLPGLSYARAQALRLEAELIEDKFDWKNWDEKIANATKSKIINEWVDELIHLKEPQIQFETLRDHYRVPLSKLPGDAVLTEKICRETIELETIGRPAKRQKYILAYAALCSLAGVPQDLKTLIPSKTAIINPISPGDLPTDSEIVDAWKSINHKAYKILFARMACYGLRPHETFKCTISTDRNEPFCKVATGTKTGRATGGRFVLPFPPEWFDELQPWLDFEPLMYSDKWKSATNRKLGNILSHWFHNSKLMWFNAYALRHRFACRMAEKNLAVGTAAKMMGHSVEIHCRVYQQALGKEGIAKAWRDATQR